MGAQNVEVPGVDVVVVYVGVGVDVLGVVEMGVGDLVTIVVLGVPMVVVLEGIVVLAVLVEVASGEGVVGDFGVVDAVLGVFVGGAVRNSRDRENKGTNASVGLNRN